MSFSRNIADISQAFEEAWQRGERPIIETFVSTLADRTSDREELLIELVHTELELRLKAGEIARVEEYLTRFPELISLGKTLRELLAAEFDFRRRREGNVSLSEYQRRFPQIANELEIALRSTTESRFPKIPGYELREVLGHGGMGRVYKAWQPKLRRWVAIKVLNSTRHVEPRVLARFEREMAALGQINHPNLVRAVDASEFDGMHYLVMEYVSGHDAAWLSQRIGAWPIAEACELIRQAAIGLQAAHETGLVHRDIKPSNVMISDVGEVKVVDLGLALWQEPAEEERTNFLGDITSTGIVMGTVDFMAPEQADDSHNVDIRADVYSLGASLFKLLTGKAPFADAGSQAKRLSATMNDPPPNIQALRRDIPEELAAIIDRLLQKNPGDRYATPCEVAAVLAEFCIGANLKALVADRIPRASPDCSPEVAKQDKGVELSGWPQIIGERLVSPESPTSAVPKSTEEGTEPTGSRLCRVGVAIAIALILIISGELYLYFKRQVELPDLENRPDQSGHYELAVTDTQPVVDIQLIQPVPIMAADGREKEKHADVAIDWSKTRSALDDLDPAKIPDAMRRTWHPKELVAVIGDEDHRHWGPARILTFSHDSKYLASGGTGWPRDGVRIWSVNDFREIAFIPVGVGTSPAVMVLAFLADGTLLAIDVRGHASVWSLGDNKVSQRYSFHLDEQTVKGALSPTGKLLVTVDYNNQKMRVTSLESFPPKEVARLDRPGGPGFFHPHFEFSRDGRVLKVDDRNGHVKLWDMTTMPPTETHSLNLGHDSDRGTPVTMTSDGRWLAYQVGANDNLLRFWDVASGKEAEERRIKHSFGITTFFSNDQSLLKFQGRDLIVVQDPLGQANLSVIGAPVPWSHLEALAGSRDGRYIASNGGPGERIHLWKQDGDRYSEVAAPPDRIDARAITFLNDCRTLGLIDANSPIQDQNSFRRLQIETGELKLASRQPVKHDPAGSALLPCLRFNSTDEEEHYAVYERANAGREPLRPADKNICCSLRPPRFNAVAYGDDPNGQHFGKIVLKSIEGEKDTHAEWQAHAGQVFRVLFSPDGNRLASYGIGDRFIRVWNMTVDPPQQTHEFFVPSERETSPNWFQMVFSPDGTRLAFSPERVWEWELSQAKPRRLSIEYSPRYGTDNLAYSPDNKQLLIGGLHDGSHNIVLWNIEKDEIDRGWKLPGVTYNTAFAPDGRHIAWVNSNRTAYVLRLSPPPANAPKSP